MANPRNLSSLVSKCISILCIASVCHGENLFIRPGGAGARNGLDWNNAWGNSGEIQWGNGDGRLGAGDACWMAGGQGNYGPFDINANGSPGNPISFMRARADRPECTSSPGWNPSFDNQVVITVNGPSCYGFRARGNNGSYIVIDGMVSRGILFDLDHRQNTQGTIAGALVLYEASVTGVTWANCQVRGLEGVPSTLSHYANGCSLGAKDPGLNRDILVYNVEFDFMGGPVTFGRNDGITLYGCTFFKCQGWGGDDHGDTIFAHMEATGPRNTKILFCLFDRCYTEGIYLALDSDSPYKRIDGFYVYGCVFRYQQGSGNKCISLAGGTGTINGLQIVNNTFIFCESTVRYGGGIVINSFVKNNIFYASDAPSIAHDYNWYSGNSTFGESHGIAGGSEMPFIDLNAGNYQIQSGVTAQLPRNKGVILDALFALDKDGTRRGKDGQWDMGAYEFKSALTETPRNLRIVP